MRGNLIKRLCGIADEAGNTLEEQLEAHRELGWEQIELRTVDGTSIVDLPEEAFRRVEQMICRSTVRVAVLDTMIGGRGRTVLTPIERDLEELQRAAERARRLGAGSLRIMSFANEGLSAMEWENRAIEKLAYLVSAAGGLEIILLHENCLGWASQGAVQTKRMMQQLNSPNLRLLFDIGNPVAYAQDGLAYLRAVAGWVAHVHVKDLVHRNGQEPEYTLIGDGHADVEASVRLLLRTGYKGMFSIEPHQAFVPHLGLAAAPEIRRMAYRRSGGRLAAMLERLEKTEFEEGQ